MHEACSVQGAAHGPTGGGSVKCCVLLPKCHTRQFAFGVHLSLGRVFVQGDAESVTCIEECKTHDLCLLTSSDRLRHSVVQRQWLLLSCVLRA